jgi:hypothetical protein
MELCNFTILGYSGCKVILAAIGAYFFIPIAITLIAVAVVIVGVVLGFIEAEINK